MMKWLRLCSLAALTSAFGSPCWAQSQDVLPPIQKGTIAIRLTPIVTGMSAPLYGISPANDNRLFVLEQKGLIQILQNGSLLPTPALDLQSRVSPPLNVTSANDER